MPDSIPSMRSTLSLTRLFHDGFLVAMTLECPCLLVSFSTRSLVYLFL